MRKWPGTTLALSATGNHSNANGRCAHIVPGDSTLANPNKRPVGTVVCEGMTRPADLDELGRRIDQYFPQARL